MSASEHLLIKDKKAAHIVEAMGRNDEMVLKSLYINNYQKIESLILKNKGTKEQAKDIYQDAFITVWKNIKNNHFVPENDTSINGYLYTIAKNKWMDYLKSSAYKKTVSFHQSDIHFSGELIIDEPTDERDDDCKLSQVMKAFQGMGEGCKALLTKFYFEKKSMKEIAAELQLDAASARNKKYRCMQTLRELAMEMKL